MEKRNANRVQVEKFDRRRPLARPRNRWKNNFKVDLERI